VHRALELLGEASADMDAALRGAAERAAREAREDASAAAAVTELLGRMMRETDLASWFAPAPGRRALVEQEFCDSDGRLFRMDRVIVDPDRVTVIDFKTGQEETAEHIEQVRGYMRILAEIFPERSVEAVLAYVDRCVLRGVS
jgi:ATP-dependent helicase/nuclease subunit A